MKDKEFVVGIGETLWDMLPDGKKLGGAPANFAYHASQFGLASRVVSAVGRDELGDKVLTHLDRKGLEHLLVRVDYPTGTVEVTLEAGGIPRYDIKRGVAWDHIPFTPEVEELAKGGVVARPHFAQVLLRHGFVSSTREAFDRYLDTSEYKRIERYKADAVSCISVIHASGGKAVLAHPCQLHYEPERLEELVRRLKEEAGLDALECYYPEHTLEMVRDYLDLARRYDLHVSAGSDFHGETVNPSKPLHPVELETDWLFA